MKTISKLTMVLMLVAFSLSEVNAQDQVINTSLERLSVLTEVTDWKTEDLYKEEYKNRDTDISITRRSRRGRRINGFWDREWGIDKYYPRRGTENFVNVYLGLNNYLQDGDLPNSNSLLSLQPLTSWYAGLNFDNVTHVFGPLYLDWGAGVSIQDFSFENTRVRLQKGANDITLTEDANISGRKSKLSMSHINLHFVPTISFGRYRSFRIGLGGYAGYRIGAHAKYKYDDAEGDKQKEKIKDNWFINPFRYGVRATVGWDFFDLFFNYDLTELFEDDVNAPRLNPVTFGVIF
ncbi:outer membrane beta-barrel protein [Roseivirga sp. E12]|uniref:outer membrane beta-barrel protein n=1 Tax=Roseivirga sp. E12 TaxID=2819237 RepID=UPI001ABC508B|nr:outer membrane beta-barrel protein [Roseivirga sp. E12]MBO3700212.1 PorT family protein [Roseivirga sp. E12]